MSGELAAGLIAVAGTILAAVTAAYMKLKEHIDAGLVAIQTRLDEAGERFNPPPPPAL